VEQVGEEEGKVLEGECAGGDKGIEASDEVRPTGAHVGVFATEGLGDIERGAFAGGVIMGCYDWLSRLDSEWCSRHC
jgi:hypothetical protein